MRLYGLRGLRASRSAGGGDKIIYRTDDFRIDRQVWLCLWS